MTEVLDSGHVITDEDVDTARLIMELDRTLGRSSDARTLRVAGTPAHQVLPVLGAGPTPETTGHHVPAADDLLATLTSEENAADLAREVGEQLDLDPAEQARVMPRIEHVIRRRLLELVAEIRPGH